MSIVFFVTFVILTTLTGFFDFLFYRIPNLFVACILIVFALMMTFVGNSKDISISLTVASITLAVGYIFYVCKWLGAGDVKFLFASSLWAANINGLAFFLSVSLAGGLLALIYYMYAIHIDHVRLIIINFLNKKFINSNFLKHYSQAPFVYASAESLKKTEIPYGIAITAGSWVITYLAIVG